MPGRGGGVKEEVGSSTETELVECRTLLLPIINPSEGSHLVWLHVAKSEKEAPQKLQISLDGRSRARVRDFEFDASGCGVSSRGAKGLTVTKWPVKAVRAVDLTLAG